MIPKRHNLKLSELCHLKKFHVFSDNQPSSLPDLDELVVLLAGEAGVVGLVVLASDDDRDPGHSAAPTHAHVHCDPSLK